MAAEAQHFFAGRAWVGGGWADDVLLTAEDGRWTAVQPGCTAAQRQGAGVLAGPVLPGLVNAHSHAFQRAIAGLTERSSGAADDFWSWRDRMYSAANRITPQQLEAVATFLYAELLQAGYTQVCEFHYLHNAADGEPYADPLEMSLALVRAAHAAGIGLTLLPTLYMRAGFGAKGLRDDQRRFASTPDTVLAIAQEVARREGGGLVNAGVALHSLRAVDEAALRETAEAARQLALPVHIHIAEQQQEVDDCIERHGQRPIEWLLGQAAPDARWNLVHATHTYPEELRGVREAGAAIVICPSTEANLGDGVFDLPGWMGQTGNWSIGSDSHVTRSWQEELRLLEYSQRLTLRQRNVAARAAVCESSAAALFEGALAGGSAATGQPLAGLAVGQRADFMVLDPQAPALLGVPDGHALDALVFSAPSAAPLQVFVAARRVDTAQVLAQAAPGYRLALRELWA
ncbi:MAG: formimidoylglutamate deiminase [Burkholderiales bacterium]|nr:formimidoylglutamate deiminase [Burkholderiales bacterium]